MLSEAIDGKHIVILSKGDLLLETLTKYITDKRIQGGQITAIGAIEDVDLGYYDLEAKDYNRKIFSNKDYELVSLLGNISYKEGEPYVHAHISMSDEEYKTYGGHLFEARVAVTVEVFITEFGKMPERVYDDNIGLGLICRFLK